MRAFFLVPPIHDRPTGGNIYNRRIISKLQSDGDAEALPWTPGEEAPPSLPPCDDAVLVVDSLLVRQEAPLRALREAHPTVPLVLLAHYLHCIDPTEQASPVAETERAGLRLFDGVVTTSRYARQALIDTGVPGDRIKVVPPGLDARYRAPLPSRPARASPRLLTVANLLPGKGLRRLVDTLAALADLDWTWTLVGDDTLDPDAAERLRARIRQSPVAGRVTGTGAIPPSELRQQYDRADVFVLPSRFETCSMATREAMARGLPVVAFDVGGLSENVGDAPAGRLVPPDASGALADALRTVLADAEKRTAMGRAARERSRTFPDWEEAGARLSSFLYRLTGEKAP